MSCEASQLAIAELAERALNTYRNIDVLFPIYTLTYGATLIGQSGVADRLADLVLGVTSAYQLSRCEMKMHLKMPLPRGEQLQRKGG